MRKLLPLLLFIPIFSTAQTLVSTEPMPRSALLEEFTAAGCGNCPAAHGVAAMLQDQYGDELTIIGVHGGSLAAPQAGQPDLRTADGSALWSQFGVAFQPQGLVNRQGLLQANAWNGAIGSTISGISPVNIGVSSVFDDASQTITVDVELYYTGMGPVGDDVIHVALTQDGIVARQADYVNGTQQNYMHRHVLRDLITPVAGDPVTTTDVGTFVERSYSLVIPAEWDLADLDVVAFVGEAAGSVHQVRQVNADGGITTGLLEDGSFGLGAPFPVPASEELTFPVSEVAGGRLLTLRDGLGRIVAQERVGSGASNMTFSVSGLSEGLYLAGFDGGATRKVIIAR